ncbi:MAG: phosphatidylserine decarboxylase family protein [Deltaproteobacteria bacterium]|nr:phosphatidylserine decarboxylase family protein [Deltaproteobacteria bacterium]
MGKRVHNSLPVAREGLPFIGLGVALTAVFFLLDMAAPFLVAGVLTVFTVYFFRDPDRLQEVTERTVLAPADGRVVDIQVLDGKDNLLGESAVKVSVFMSLFNVHVNRIPARGRISDITYQPGRFVSANLDKASEQNENNRITLQTGGGAHIVFVQIAGLIARRIACWVREGDDVTAGQRFGLIRFGSRVDIYLPRNTRIVVGKAQKVKGGETILGYLP